MRGIEPLMKRYTIALMAVAFVVTIGMLGANGLLATPFVIAKTTTSTMNGDIPLQGHVTLVVNSPDGKIKTYRQMDNVVVNVGEECTGARLFGDSAICGANLFNYLAIGTGAGAELTSNTSLGTETLSRIQDLSNTQTNSTGTGATSQVSATFTATATAAIAESGLFDASSGGHMFARKLISPVVNVVSGDQLTVTWTITTGS